MLKIVPALAVAAFVLLSPGTLRAEPLDLSPIDCAGPVGDPAPGTNEWRQRDAENMYCAEQRHLDQVAHPNTFNQPVPQVGNDAYRDPNRAGGPAGIRFRFEEVTVGGLVTEIYRPCSNAPGDCPNLPAGLPRFDPPYPVVITLHGLLSRKEYQWWAAQPLAEAGYLVANVNTSQAGPTLANAQTVLNWLSDPNPAVNPFAPEINRDRIGISGHSQGGGVSFNLTRQDPRIKALVDEDDYTSSQGTGEAQRQYKPTLLIFADYEGFPGYPQPRSSPPSNPDAVRGDSGKYTTLKDENVDVMKLVLRASTHLDWVGAWVWGNRYAELVTVYYMIAWFDRYLKGLDDPVMAGDAYARLTAPVFDDSADRHNLSQGFWDPVQALASLDPLYGGNVPYRIEGMPVDDRLSFYWLSKCSITVPGTAIRAVSEDMRNAGCVAEVLPPLDSDGDGIPDDVDACPFEPGPPENDGCPLPPDTTPDAFGFTSVSGVSQNTVVSSNVVTISGIDAPSPVGVSNGEYRINGGVWTSAAGSISNGQTVQVRHASAATANTVTETTLTVGGVSGKFRSTTSAGADTDPDAFTFGTKTDVNQGEWVVSDAIEPEGYNAPATVKAGSGTQYSIGCTQDNWLSTQGTISPGTPICVRHQSASTANTLRKTSLQIGKTVGYFSTRTAAP